MMKHILYLALFVFISHDFALAQIGKKGSKKPQFFNRTELYYTFGINETYPGQQSNSMHIKTVLGFSTPKIGFGFGIENGSYRAANGTYGASFNTIAFSGNMHYLAKPVIDDGTNFFIKGGLGYAVAIFNGYDKGLNIDAATGIILTNKRKRKYFLEGVYSSQEFDNYHNTHKIKVNSIGFGIGSWF
jgi:hypothetical protein